MLVVPSDGKTYLLTIDWESVFFDDSLDNGFLVV